MDGRECSTLRGVESPAATVVFPAIVTSVGRVVQGKVAWEALRETRVPAMGNGAVRTSVVSSWTTWTSWAYRGVKCRASAAAWWSITRRIAAFIVYTLITAVSSSRPCSP